MSDDEQIAFVSPSVAVMLTLTSHPVLSPGCEVSFLTHTLIDLNQITFGVFDVDVAHVWDCESTGV